MASRSINKVVLLGNLTRDPQVKYTGGGTPVATFGVATNRTWKTNDGQTKEDVQYHNIVAWAKLAENAGKILTKGRKIYLEGRITTRKFTDKTGQERTVTEIVMEDFIVFSDGRRSDSADTTPNQQEKSNPSSESRVHEDVAPNQTSESSDIINPDDIPF
jgi:single-strand DNA-binding protein